MQRLIVVIDFIDMLNDWVGKVLWFGIIVIALLVLSEVIRRYLFNAPTVWGNELTQLVFAVYVILSGGHILRWGGHVNVDIMYSHLSERNQALADIVTSVLFFLFCGMMLIYGGSLAWESLSIWERSSSAWRPPLYPVKMMIPVGALLLLLQGSSKLIRDIMFFFGGYSEKNDEGGNFS